MHRPRTITLAFQAALASLLLGTAEIVLGVFDWDWAEPLFGYFFFGSAAAMSAVGGAVLYLWYQRRRWARWVFIGILVVSLPLQLWGHWTFVPDTWDGWTAGVGYLTLDFLTLGLLFTPSARSWFGTAPTAQGAFERQDATARVG